MIKESQSFIETFSNFKNIIAGIFVILGFIGGAYGSLKPETAAQEGYDILVLDVDMLLDQAYQNNEMIHLLENKLIKLETSNDFMRSILIGKLVTKNPEFQVPEQSLIEPEPISEDFEILPVQRQEPRRPRAVPSWKK